MLDSMNTPRYRFSDSHSPPPNIHSQNLNLNPGIRRSLPVTVDDYEFFTPLMSRRSKVCKFLKIYCCNLKQDFSEYFKTSFFFPLSALSGTVMAAASSIYLGILSEGWRPKLIIPTLLATQVVVPHGIVGGLAVGTTVITVGIFIKSLIWTVKIVRMTPAERLLVSYRNTYKTLQSLNEKEPLICGPLSTTDIQRKNDLLTFLEKRASACQSILADSGADIAEYQSLGLISVLPNQQHAEHLWQETEL